MYRSKVKNEMGLSLNDISSTSRISRSERNSPVPFQRKISASGMSQFTSCDSGSVAPFNTSPRESNSEINNNENDQNESTACQRFYWMSNKNFHFNLLFVLDVLAQ